MITRAQWSLLLLVLGACDKDSSDSAESDADTDTDTDTDTDSDSDTDSDTDTDTDSDTDSDTDTDTDTDTTPVCGDGVVGGTEECDDKGESKDCDPDCTYAECGDGTLNVTAGESCEPTSPEPWDRCAACAIIGAGLDGTFGKKWETLSYPGTASDYISGLQSFHYSGATYIYDFTVNAKYDIAKDDWSGVGTARPWGGASNWVNGAVDSNYIYVARNSSMYQFDMTSEKWTELATSIPDGSDRESAAVFDGEGYIWYEGPKDTTIRFDPVKLDYAEYPHDALEMFETRVAYDPISHKLLLAGFQSDQFLVLDIATGKFSETSSSPGGSILDSTCGDNSGGVYVGSNTYTTMYRYDLASDTWDELPALPASHDNNSSCVVSQDGWLYYPTQESYGFYRMQLGLVAR